MRIYALLGSLALLFSSLPTSSLLAQTLRDGIQVDYDMDVELIPASHQLKVKGSFTLRNTSPWVIDSIPVQLFANGYSGRNTPFAKQLAGFGSAKMYFAKDSDLGGYDSLGFDESRLQKVFQPDPELIWLIPSVALAPGDTLRVPFHYRLRIPAIDSRLGRKGQAYYLTQWYPKVALRDTAGWHPMPYLELGEYYQTFGRYDVRISVPTNGMVAASGTLINPEGQAARTARVLLSQAQNHGLDSLQYGDGLSTFHYTADLLPDFAWFCSPDFMVQEHSQPVAGKTHMTYAYFPPSEAAVWKDASLYLGRALHFVDSLLAPYPYPQMTAVSAPKLAGGGMEYPMITLIGATGDTVGLDAVLAHETFHNWFALSLASNERRHAWLDEGLTTWLEGKYMRRYHPPRYGKSQGPWSRINYLGLEGLAYMGIDPHPDYPLDELPNEAAYFLSAYAKPGVLFGYAEAAMGTEAFIRGIRDYINSWTHRNPGPQDLKESLAAEAQVDWLFEALLHPHKGPDYKIERVWRDSLGWQAQVRNRGDLASPLLLAPMQGDALLSSIDVHQGFLGRDTVRLAYQQDFERLAIDPEIASHEIRRSNNYYSPGAAFPRLESLRLRFLTDFGKPTRSPVSLLPVLSYNAGAGFMLGLAAHNFSLKFPRTRFWAMPLVGFDNATINGLAGLRHRVSGKTGQGFELWDFYADGRRFAYYKPEAYDFSDRFNRLKIGSSILLPLEGSSPSSLRLYGQAFFVKQTFARGLDASQGLFDENSRSYSLLQTGLEWTRSQTLHPFTSKFQFETGSEYGRLTGSFEFSRLFSRKGLRFSGRTFAGALLWIDEPTPNVRLLPNGISGFLVNQYDYTFEHWIVNRERSNAQTWVRDGSLSIPFLLPVPWSDEWLLSQSLVMDIWSLGGPLALLKAQAYADVAFYPGNDFVDRDWVSPATGGLRIAVLEDVLLLNLPLANSSLIRESLAFSSVSANYWDRISFQLRLNMLDPDQLLNRFLR